MLTIQIVINLLCFVRSSPAERWYTAERNLQISYKKLSSNEGCLSSKSIEGRLPYNFIFHRMLSSIKGRFPSKVIFHQRLYSIKVCLPSKIVLHLRSSSIIIISLVEVNQAIISLIVQTMIEVGPMPKN